jgi:hypothetical protein
MPCELGMTITWQQLNPARHTWFVLKTKPPSAEVA